MDKPTENQIDIELLQAQINALFLREQVKEQMAGQLKYTFLVVVTGYGMLLTLWAKLYQHMPILAAGWSAILIGTSILTFFIHEFYKTWVEGNHVQTHKLILSLSPKEALAKATEAEAET